MSVLRERHVLGEPLSLVPAAPARAFPVKELALLAAWCGVLFFYGLTAGELYRTESLRAIIGAEFLRTGDWVVPRLYGEPLFTKPPGMYAAIAAVSWPFGAVTAVTARLPSALAASLAVFLFYGMFGRVFGRRAGLLAAAVLPMSVMWLEKAPAAEIDMLQVAWVMAAILAAVRAVEADETDRPGETAATPRQGFRWWVLALLCVAGGVLTKWTAPLFFYGTVLPLLAWRGRTHLLRSAGHLTGVAVAGVLCLGWVVAAVSLGGWAGFSETVGREFLQRFSPWHHQEVQAMLSGSHHSAVPAWVEILLHPLFVLGSNLPWSLFALLTLRRGFMSHWQGRAKLLLQALHCWAWPNLFLWSVIPEHAARHTLPLYPALAGLAVFWLVKVIGRQVRDDLPASQEPPGNPGPPRHQPEPAARVWRGSLTPDVPCPLSDRFAPGDLSPVSMALRGEVDESAVELSPEGRPVGLRTVAVRFVAVWLVLWLIVKVTFVEFAVPKRNVNRRPREKGEAIAKVVPAGETLYLFQLKDEGIMFYYGRDVKRLPSPADLPSIPEPVYCILNESEWATWHTGRRAEVVLRLNDEQNAPLVLLKVSG